MTAIVGPPTYPAPIQQIFLIVIFFTFGVQKYKIIPAYFNLRNKITGHLKNNQTRTRAQLKLFGCYLKYKSKIKNPEKLKRFSG
jgi:hypothetical protein